MTGIMKHGHRSMMAIMVAATVLATATACGGAEKPTVPAIAAPSAPAATPTPTPTPTPSPVAAEPGTTPLTPKQLDAMLLPVPKGATTGAKRNPGDGIMDIDQYMKYLYGADASGAADSKSRYLAKGFQSTTQRSFWIGRNQLVSVRLMDFGGMVDGSIGMVSERAAALLTLDPAPTKDYPLPDGVQGHVYVFNKANKAGLRQIYVVARVGYIFVQVKLTADKTLDEKKTVTLTMDQIGRIH
jgi:hypothetical protein